MEVGPRFSPCSQNCSPDSAQPTDLVKQSIPFAYMAVSAVSTDGASHSVQVYSDISAEWVSGDTSLEVDWSTTADSVVTHQVQLISEIPFTEINDRTQCKKKNSSTSWLLTASQHNQMAQPSTRRSAYVIYQALINTFIQSDANFRLITRPFNQGRMWLSAPNLSTTGA